MGGPMSVNDDLPWIEPACALIRAAAAKIPMLGHCLGGQLMSKALGGTITKNPVPEMIECWRTQWQDEIATDAHLATVQESEIMRKNIPKKLPELRRVADQLYSTWTQGLFR